VWGDKLENCLWRENMNLENYLVLYNKIQGLF
jgi:hypothetical protein